MLSQPGVGESIDFFLCLFSLDYFFSVSFSQPRDRKKINYKLSWKFASFSDTRGSFQARKGAAGLLGEKGPNAFLEIELKPDFL